MSTEDRTAPTNVGTTSSTESVDSQAAALLAEAPVELVAEVGRLRLTADELLGLVHGSVLGLGRRRLEVQLRVGDHLWAKGELVNVDEELAVRITSVERRG